jgi:hypothetical protein
VTAIERALANGRGAPRPGVPWSERVEEMVARISEVLEARP